ncbi:acyltransferase family protein [Sphingomonas immobilis]|uniref:Acyltransferase n=1 Tax=Sphingomonas immobilis TaxID=3063997 RepID=A0ABT9A455_9SPHN|nr:acyltransferase [Sphingomonas sp. CA1-15]MDO7844619.1 acyltransferase [Sphingomonas sp. CA1-15]
MIRPYPKAIVPLTSLRFFAAFWVVIYHYVDWLPNTRGPDLPFIGSGLLGVDFFFILSGFILTHAHMRQIEERSLAVKPFLIRRLAKIYPMHLATLLFYVALVTALTLAHMKLPNPERYSGVQFVLNVLLIHAWQITDAGAWNFPSWSISAEWFAYLLFPFMAPFLVRRMAGVRAEWLVAGALALLVIVWLIAPFVLGASYFALHSNFGYIRIMPEFLLGIALYRLGRERSMAWLEGRAIVPLLTLAIVVLATFRFLFPTLLLLALLILAAAEVSRQGRTGLLTSRVLSYLGEASYSLYMIHLPVATLVLQGVRLKLGHTPLIAVILALPLAVLIAIGSFELIEKPCQRLLLRLARQRPPAPVQIDPKPAV